MTKNVYWTIQATIKDGKFDALEEFCKTACKATDENEPGVMHYEWWISPDKKTLHLHERYADAEAVLTHLGNMGPQLPVLMECITPTAFMVYGPVNDGIKSALADMGPMYFNQVGGFSRG